MKTHYPDVYLYSFFPAERVHISRKIGKSLADMLTALKDAGLDSVPGASDLLVDRIRQKVNPNKIMVAQWIGVSAGSHKARSGVPWLQPGFF